MARVRKAIFPAVLFCSLILSAIAFLSDGSYRQAQANTISPELASVTPAPVPIPPQDCAWVASYPQSVARWCELIQVAASESELPGSLIAALMLEESGGDPLAISKDGAVGLLQVMPRDGIAGNFNCQNGPCFASRPTITELQDPVYNLRYGTRYLSGLIHLHGSTRDALKYYGPTGAGYSYADAVLSIQSRFQ